MKKFIAQIPYHNIYYFEVLFIIKENQLVIIEETSSVSEEIDRERGLYTGLFYNRQTNRLYPNNHDKKRGNQGQFPKELATFIMWNE